MLEVRVREAVSILPGPSRFQVHVCVCGGRGGCSNHGRALGTPNLTQDEQEYPRELLRGSVQTGACPQAAVWGSRMLELRPLPGAQVGFERPSVFESWLFLLLGLGLRTVPEPPGALSHPKIWREVSFTIFFSFQFWDYLTAGARPGQVLGGSQGSAAQTLPLGGGRWGWSEAGPNLTHLEQRISLRFQNVF